MSVIFIRHGQASAGSANYDQLSAKGELQSARLGHWLVEHGQSFDAVLLGTMRRHQQTYEGIVDAYRQRGVALPEPELDPDLDEFDHHAVFDGFARGNPQHDAVLARAGGSLQSLGALIHSALSAWSEDSIDDLPETWQVFGGRVHAASARLAARGASNVLVVTSGGVISRIAQQVLGASDRVAIDLNLSLRNSGLCEFHPRPYGLALGSWNALPHLHDQRDLWTYY